MEKNEVTKKIESVITQKADQPYLLTGVTESQVRAWISQNPGKIGYKTLLVRRSPSLVGIDRKELIAFSGSFWTTGSEGDFGFCGIKTV